MEKPNVTVKNVKTFEGHDGMGFNADVYISGVKCYSVHDGAYGGCLEFDEHSYSENPMADVVRKNIKLLDDYIATLPVEPFMLDGKQMMNIKNEPCFNTVDLDQIVNELIDEHLKQKQEKKFEKICENTICFGKPNSSSYYRIKLKYPLDKIPTMNLQRCIDGIKKDHFKDGYVFLNKNLKERQLSL